MNPSDKLLLLKKASTLPVGSPERKAILSRFEGKKAASGVDPHLPEGTRIRLLEPTTLYYQNDASAPAFGPKHKKYNLKAQAGEVLYYQEYSSFYKTMNVFPLYKLTKSGKPNAGGYGTYALLDNPRFEVVAPESKLAGLTMKAAARNSDAEILLGDIAMKAGLDDSKVRKTPGGAELVDQDDWLTYTISISDDGRYEIKAEGQARGSIPYMPYEDHDEMADDLLRGNTPFRVLRR